MRHKSLEFLIVIEKSRNGYGAFSPDIPGVGVVGRTRSETKRLLKQAISSHLQGLKADGLKIPKPTSQADYLRVAA